MLYRPDDLEPPTDEPWYEERIRDGIREIVADTGVAVPRAEAPLARATAGSRSTPPTASTPDRRSRSSTAD